MIAEWAFIVIGSRFQGREVNPFGHHLVQAPARQVRVTAHQTLEPRHFREGAQRRSAAAVEFGHLLEAEVFELEPRADVEGLLVEVGDEQVRLGCVSDGQRQPPPRPRRVQRPLVMPGAEQPEDLAAEIAGEEPVNLIKAPDDLG